MSTAVQIRQADAEADAAAREAFQRETQQAAPAAQPPKPAVPLQNPDGTPTPAGWRRIGEALRRPMQTKERPGRGNIKFQYVTAKAVMDRLDEVVGPGNWSTHYFIVNPVGPIVECTLTIFGVAKADVGMCNAPEKPELEAAKSAYSDSLKRAAVQFGVARFIGQDDD